MPMPKKSICPCRMLGTCTKTCVLGPYCGDGRIQPNNNEQCDDKTAGCGSDCHIIVVQ